MTSKEFEDLRTFCLSAFGLVFVSISGAHQIPLSTFDEGLDLAEKRLRDAGSNEAADMFADLKKIMQRPQAGDQDLTG